MKGKFSLFTRVAGLTLIFSSAPLYALVWFADVQNRNLKQVIRTKGENTFVILQRGQIHEGYNGKKHYYYSYMVPSPNEDIRVIEEVNPEFYHLNREGKNAEAVFYRTESGLTFSKLRWNRIEDDKVSHDFSSLSTLSLSFCLLGTLLLAVTPFFAWMDKHPKKLQTHQGETEHEL